MQCCTYAEIAMITICGRKKEPSVGVGRKFFRTSWNRKTIEILKSRTMVSTSNSVESYSWKKACWPFIITIDNYDSSIWRQQSLCRPIMSEITFPHEFLQNKQTTFWPFSFQTDAKIDLLNNGNLQTYWMQKIFKINIIDQKWLIIPEIIRNYFAFIF